MAKKTAELLPEDLIFEILSRSPAKSVMRWKLVCKIWYRLISEVFVVKFSCAAASCPSGFLFRGHLCESSRFLGFATYPSDSNRCDGSSAGFVDSLATLLPFKPSPSDLLDCCNGLLLFRLGSKPLYYVCNPTTQQAVAIPKHPRQISPLHAALAFDPSQSLHYKVVRFRTSKLGCRLSIFSSDTAKWVGRSLIIQPPSAYSIPWGKRTVYLDGIFYKLLRSKYLLRIDLNASTALAVDLPVNDEVDSFGFMGASNGRLYYSNQDKTRLEFLIWLLEDRDPHKDYPFLTLKHRISIPHLTSIYPAAAKLETSRYSNCCKAYAIHPTSSIIFLGTHSSMFSYNLQNQELRVVFEMHIKRDMVWGQDFVLLYFPCFVALKDFGNNPSEFSKIDK